MALEILGDPFADRASTVLEENFVRNTAPSLPDTKVQDLLDSAQENSWDKQEGVNERYLFDKELVSIGSQISAELGPFALDAYGQAQDLIGAGLLQLLNEGDRTGSFRGQNARGGSQWDMQQLTVGSLEDTDNYGAEPTEARIYNTGGPGGFNIAPKLDTNTDTVNVDPTSTDVGSGPGGSHGLDNDTQAVFILGFSSSTNPRVVEQARIDVDDGDERTAFDVFTHNQLGTLQAFETPSVEYIDDDDNFDINGSATQNASTDLYPFGVDFNVASRLPDLGTNLG